METYKDRISRLNISIGNEIYNHLCKMKHGEIQAYSIDNYNKYIEFCKIKIELDKIKMELDKSKIEPDLTIIYPTDVEVTI